VWCSVISGWTSHEKQRYIRERGLPVTEAYLALGFSGECIACAHDNAGLLTDIDLLCPELSYAIRTLALWLYQRVKRGDVDLAPKRLRWGWNVDDDTQVDTGQTQLTETAQSMVGCADENCKTMDDKPTWILDLPSWQLVDRQDVLDYWDTGELPTERFKAEGEL